MSLKTKAKEVDGNYVLDGITIGRVTDLKPNEWFGKVMLSNVGEEYAEYGLLDPMAIVKGDDGVTYKDPKGGSDGSRGSLLEPDGTPVVNVTSYDEDEHEDFMKDLFSESKANEEYMSIKDAVAMVDNHREDYSDDDSYNKEIAKLTGWDEATVDSAIYNMSDDPDDPYNEKVGEAKATEDFGQFTIQDPNLITDKYPTDEEGFARASWEDAEIEHRKRWLIKAGFPDYAEDDAWLPYFSLPTMVRAVLAQDLHVGGIQAMGESKANEEMSLHEQLLQHFSVHTSPDPEQRGSSFIGVGKCRICGEKVEFNSGDEKIEVMDNHLRKEHDEVFPLKGSWAYDRFGANENSNWKAFNNTQRQEIIDLADVSVSADTEWEDISVSNQEDLSIHLVSQGALASADFTGFADEYVNELKLDGLNIRNHGVIGANESKSSITAEDIVNKLNSNLSSDYYPRETIHIREIENLGDGKVKFKYSGGTIDPEIESMFKASGFTISNINNIIDSGHLDAEGKLGESKASEFSLKEFKDQQDINYHTENAVALVRQYGTSDEIREIEDLALRHRTSGHGIDKQDQIRRDEFLSKYYPRLLNDASEEERNYQSHYWRETQSGEAKVSDIAKAEEDRVCPICGEESPYVRMGDFWETHFADKHRLNESKANEFGKLPKYTEKDRELTIAFVTCPICSSNPKVSHDSSGGYKCPNCKTNLKWIDDFGWEIVDANESKANETLESIAQYFTWKVLEDISLSNHEMFCIQCENERPSRRFEIDVGSQSGIDEGSRHLEQVHGIYDMNQAELDAEDRRREAGSFPFERTYESKANENVASKLAYYYQKDAPKDWNDNQVSNEAEKILEETYGIKPKKEVVKVEAKESLSTIQQKIVDRKLDGVRNESIIHELKIWDEMSEEQAKKAVETTEIPLQDSIAYTLFNKKYAECNENEIQELKIYAGESRVKASEAYSDPECMLCGRVMHNSFEQNDDKESIRYAILRHYDEYHTKYLEATTDVVDIELKKQLAKTGRAMGGGSNSQESKASEEQNLVEDENKRNMKFQKKKKKKQPYVTDTEKSLREREHPNISQGVWDELDSYPELMSDPAYESKANEGYKIEMGNGLWDNLVDGSRYGFLEDYQGEMNLPLMLADGSLKMPNNITEVAEAIGKTENDTVELLALYSHQNGWITKDMLQGFMASESKEKPTVWTEQDEDDPDYDPDADDGLKAKELSSKIEDMKYDEEPMRFGDGRGILGDPLYPESEKASEDMKWWECEDCKFFGKTEEETTKHELETGHTTHKSGMTSAFPINDGLGLIKGSKANEGMAECPHCDGEGKIDVDWTGSGIAQCPACNGSGKMDKKLADDYIQNDMDQTSRARSNMYGDDEYIDGSDVPTSGFYESIVNEVDNSMDLGLLSGGIPEVNATNNEQCEVCGQLIDQDLMDYHVEQEHGLHVPSQYTQGTISQSMGDPNYDHLEDWRSSYGESKKVANENSNESKKVNKRRGGVY